MAFDKSAWAREKRKDPEYRAKRCAQERAWRASQTLETKEARYAKHRVWVEENKEHCRDYAQKRRHANPATRMVKSARGRAKRLGISFGLTAQDLGQLPTHCPVYGIELDYKRTTMGDSSPSIDRKNNARGYEKDNVVVVSMRANKHKSDSTSAERAALVSFYDGGRDGL